MLSAAANAATFFVDRHIAEGRGAKVAYTEAETGRSLTYTQMHQGAAQMAGALSRADIRPEERAAVLVLDQIEFPQIFFGALKAGVIPVPLNTLLATPVYDATLRDARAAILFVSAPLWEVVAPAVADNPYLRHVVVLGAAPEGTVAYDDFVAGAAPQDTCAVSPDEAAFWLYSSGSTGQPKGVVHIHSAMQATAETYGAQVLGIREDDVVLSAAKFFRWTNTVPRMRRCGFVFRRAKPCPRMWARVGKCIPASRFWTVWGRPNCCIFFSAMRLMMWSMARPARRCRDMI